ncbi:hypothetical protein LINPERHAP1_LOCUS17715 [Linum perenne]
MQAGKGSNSSWGWRGIFKGREIIKVGHRWQVGDGVLINPYLDHWIPTFPPSAPILNMRDLIIDFPISVAGFIDNDNWDQTKLEIYSGRAQPIKFSPFQFPGVEQWIK